MELYDTWSFVTTYFFHLACFKVHVVTLTSIWFPFIAKSWPVVSVPHFVARLDRFHLLAVVSNTAVNICGQVCVDISFHFPRSGFAGSYVVIVYLIFSKFSKMCFFRILRWFFFLFKAINFSNEETDLLRETLLSVLDSMLVWKKKKERKTPNFWKLAVKFLD